MATYVNYFKHDLSNQCFLYQLQRLWIAECNSIKKYKSIQIWLNECFWNICSYNVTFQMIWINNFANLPTTIKTRPTIKTIKLFAYWMPYTSVKVIKNVLFIDLKLNLNLNWIMSLKYSVRVISQVVMEK